MEAALFLSPDEGPASSDIRNALPGGARIYMLSHRLPETVLAPGKVTLGVSPDIENADSGQLVKAVLALMGDRVPELILFRDGPLFELMGARLAGALGRTAVRGVTRMAVSDGALTLEKAVFGGKAEIGIALEGPAVVAMAAGGAGEDASRAEVEVVDLGALPPETTERRRVEDTSGSELSGARVIVSGGRGLGSGEAYAALQELAGLLGAALGASRAAVDEGWASPTRQVGLTGQKVAPELYLAIGISGASQHMAGISGAKKVIAITKDPRAPILDAADVGVVADWHALWPELRKTLER